MHITVLEWDIGHKIKCARIQSLHHSDMNVRLKIHECRNPTLAKCGGEAQHLEKLGIWSPPRLPNVQSSTARPKTPRIEVFLVSLKRS